MSKTDTPREILSQRLMTAAVGVLGSMLIDEAAVGPMLMALEDSDFLDGAQRNVFRAFRELYGAGRAADPILINERLGGGYDKLLTAWMEATPTAANADAYAAALKRSSRLWRLRQIGDELGQAEDEDACRALMDRANLLLCDRAGVRRVTMAQALKDWFRRHSGERPREFLRWGFSDLDELIHAGAGDMVVVGGYPSAGKTAFALQAAFSVAKKRRVGFFSYETDADKLHDRTVACQTHVSFGRIMTDKLTEEDFSRVKDCAKVLTTPQLELLEASGMTVSAIGSYAMAHHYDVIVVDYLQKIPAARVGRYLSDYERVSQVSSDLQQLGRTTGKTIVALSQLSRPDKRKDGTTPPPSLSSLRQSGQIEQDADIVLLLYKEYQDHASSRRCLDVAKNKDGAAGVGLLLNFDGDKQYFYRSAGQRTEARPREEAPRQTSLFRPVAADGPTPFDQTDTTREEAST